ncbi:MAG: hypothetical protein CMG63_00020 [Candidatus Marinimicrobia bacterium]|nr:hypothetical protein [Candidatus Neomarinimicrobiota bacterium]|tara:strand:+ start:256 stop:579 length:324 start_codon:yes stop_codon:yes gene_type:complete
MQLSKNNVCPSELSIEIIDFNIGVPDGKYFGALLNSFDYANENEKYPFKTYDFFSITPIKIIDGLIDVHSLKKAAAELLTANQYWGRFIEGAYFNYKKNVIEIVVGS